MDILRRIALLIAALSAAALAVVGPATAAFATRPAPLNDGGQAATSVNLAGSGGLDDWQVALVVVATALVTAIVTAVIVRARSRERLSAAVQ
jgi:hypothetical protein